MFQRYQQNAVKKISALPAEWGEKKIFTAIIASLTNSHRTNFDAYHSLEISVN